MRAILTALVIFALIAPAAAEGRSAPFAVNAVVEPETLDPGLAASTAEDMVINTLFEGLVSSDTSTGEPRPALAESWTLSPDGTAYTFELKKGIRWSDGVPITAATFRGSWLRTMAPETAAPYSYIMATIVEGAQAYVDGKAGPDAVGIEVLGERTLRLRMPNPVPWALSILGLYYFDAVPMHVIAKKGSDWAKPGNLVSSGPFTLASWVPGDRILVEANPLYWDAASVALGSIEFRFVEDTALAFKLYEAGEFDLLHSPPLPSMDTIKLRPDFHKKALPIVEYVKLNVAKRPLDDPRVRRALSLAIDRRALCDKVLSGLGQPATAFVPDLPGYPASQAAERDVERARALLAQAGFPGGRGFPELGLLSYSTLTQRIIAEFLQSQWKEALGITIVSDRLEFRYYLQTFQAGDYHLARAGWFADYLDPLNFLELFTSGKYEDHPAAPHFWSNPRFDELLDRARAAPSGQARFDLFRQAEAILTGEEQGVIPLFYGVGTTLLDPSKWEGWIDTPFGGSVSWKTIRPASRPR